MTSHNLFLEGPPKRNGDLLKTIKKPAAKMRPFLSEHRQKKGYSFSFWGNFLQKFIKVFDGMYMRTLRAGKTAKTLRAATLKQARG